MTGTRRLAFVNHYPNFGGPHNRAVRLHGPLHDNGWETVVFLPSEAGTALDRMVEAGLKVVTLPLPRLRASRKVRQHVALLRRTPNGVRALRAAFRENDIDLVVVVGLENPHAYIAAKLEGIPVVAQIVDTLLPPAIRMTWAPAVLSMADVVMTTGSRIGRLYGGVRSKGSRWFPFFSPVEVDVFRSSTAARESARGELGIGRDEYVIGTVGNLVPPKGHRLFIDGAVQLRAAGVNARFVILGETLETHRRYAAQLLAGADALGLQVGRDLISVSPGDRVSQLMQAFDLFWMTSAKRSEGVPTVVMEAMALGLPVVSTAVAGVPDVVADGETGVLIRPGDPNQLAAATASLLASPATRIRMGIAARKLAEQRFATEHCVRTHLAAFDAAVAHRANGVTIRGGLRTSEAGGAGREPRSPP